ncbi:hypothetical protein H0H93_005698, partial [Arthromyces matolae]
FRGVPTLPRTSRFLTHRVSSTLTITVSPTSRLVSWSSLLLGSCAAPYRARSSVLSVHLVLARLVLENRSQGPLVDDSSGFR